MCAVSSYKDRPSHACSPDEHQEIIIENLILKFWKHPKSIEI